MRILELSWEYPPNVEGGMGSHVAALAPALGALGHAVSVLTPRWKGGEPREQQNGVTVYRVEPPVRALDYFVNVQQTNLRLEEFAIELIAQQGAYDLIHAHDWLMALLGIGLKLHFKIPLVATIHATERGRWGGHVAGDMSRSIIDSEWWLMFEAWRVITVSRYMATELKNYFDLPANKVDVIPNGVDTRPFDALDGVDLSDFRRQYAQPDERLVFTVSRLTHEKGVHLLVEAAPHVLAEFPQTQFVIAGKGQMLETLQARAAELGVSERVKFAGFISDDTRNQLYRVADCAVFPSLYEPFGIVALEAMAAKSPLVVASSGGLAEFVQHHQTGITVYPDSVESLTEGILHTLRRPDWARARAQNAYAMVVQRYNWRNIAERTLRVFQRVVDERSKTDW